MHHLAKSLFFGGVTQRFPGLSFAFLEAGVTWAAALLADLVGHWEKRNLEMTRRRDPSRLDRPLFRRLHEQWGAPGVVSRLSDEWLQGVARDDAPENIDEFSHLRIERVEDIRDAFVDSFYFGCEADDTTNAFAFSPANAFGARLRAIFSSDLGHWDVPDMEDLVEESYELLERGHLTPEDYRDFMFANPANLHLRMNPAFFEGTPCDSAAAALLDERPA
jgi:hypothetical protein